MITASLFILGHWCVPKVFFENVQTLLRRRRILSISNEMKFGMEGIDLVTFRGRFCPKNLK
jgi:hypothetical protein